MSPPPEAPAWLVAIDVGGTFTDCIAWSRGGEVRTAKLLSSGATRGRIGAGTEAAGPAFLFDAARATDPERFWEGYAVRLLDAAGGGGGGGGVAACARGGGGLGRAGPRGGAPAPGDVYELASGEPAPITGIRRMLGLRLDEAIPPLEVRLGTTRGTNALLTRTGKRTALVTTRGHGDVLRIGTQARPRLFDLAIRKPEPLFERVVEIDERVTADGQVLEKPDAARVAAAMRELAEDGIEAAAICLLHGFAHPAHERLVGALAREAGIGEVSLSSEVAPLEKIVWRGDTTVLDAYLNPVLREYVAALRASLRGSSLHFMTSAGGLCEAAQFSGKDSILSGPAGGAAGVAFVARAAGAPRAIGFDMGGTSTDVSRWAGGFERELETEKAGVRVVAPMIAIETVAAGGGSICGFDGDKLTVGPASAGASPGPACYGAGGPLTLTDVNVVLGRVPAHRFPFPLDRAAAVARLDALCEAIARAPTGRRMGPLELAHGFLRVANAGMVRAIRSVSVQKGHDPRGFSLVAFGGAGAQHACALARELGVREVLCHPLAGFLSAWGIGLADVRRLGVKSVLAPFSDAEVAGLEPAFAELEAALAAEVVQAGVPRARVLPGERSLDLRYEGQDAAIAVPLPHGETWRAAFERMHERLYGYHHAGRGLEIVALRLEVSGRARDEPGAAPAPAAEHRAVPAEEVTAWFDGAPRRVPVFLREHLAPGDALEGPAIVCEAGSTIVVEAGWRARVDGAGTVLLTDAGLAGAAAAGVAAAAARGAVAVDPVDLEIHGAALAAVAEQMGVTLRRTASSTNVKERLDYSSAIFTAEGDLVVNAQHIPVHLGAMGETVRRLVADGPPPCPGDVFVTNDPYRGGSHLPDVTVITPVFHGERLVAFAASRAHHAEIGGAVPGSMPPRSTCLAEEGVLLRSAKLVDRGASREAEIAALLRAGPYPSRRVADNLADLAAQAAANRAGAAGLVELADRIGLDVLLAYMRHLQDEAASKMRRALAALPDGRFPFVDHLDDGTPIAVTVTIRGDSATVDFTGTGPVVPGNLNANRAIVTAAVLYAFRCLLPDDLPLNAGVLAPIGIVVPPGSLLDPPDVGDPSRAAAVVGGNVETSQRIVDALLGALGAAAASQGTMNNLSFGDGTFGYYETICGGAGATPTAEGADAVHTHMTNTRLTDPEVLERRYPVRVRRFAIRRGSGGAGLHRGGDGVVRELEATAPLQVSILSERRGPYPPYGLAGGAAGALGQNRVIRAGSDTPEELPAKAELSVGPGDRIVIETPGGGGYGRPA